MKRFASPRLRSMACLTLSMTMSAALLVACGDSDDPINETSTGTASQTTNGTPTSTNNSGNTSSQSSGTPSVSGDATTTTTTGGTPSTTTTTSTTTGGTTTSTTTGGTTTTTNTTGTGTGTGTEKMLGFTADVLPIFSQSCGCHRSATPQDGLDLSDSAAYGAIVNKASKDVSAMMLVKPNDPTNSYLYRKMEDTHIAAGGADKVMPTGGKLGDDVLKKVSDWISQGAKM